MKQPVATPAKLQPVTKVIAREASEADCLAFLLSNAYARIVEQATEIAQLQTKIGKFTAESAARDKVAIEEKYGFRGNVNLSGVNADGKRTMTMTVVEMQMPEAKVAETTAPVPAETPPR